MFNGFRKLFERVVIGDSVPALVRWGESLPRPLVQKIQQDAFREVVRYAATRQKFFARQLREKGVDPVRVRRPEDLGEIFTTADDLLKLRAEDFLCRPAQAVFETTGTSGGSKKTYFGYDELDFAAKYEAAALYKNGINPGDHVGIPDDAYGGTFRLLARVLAEWGLEYTPVPLGDLDAVRAADAAGEPLLVLAGGSNLVVADEARG